MPGKKVSSSELIKRVTGIVERVIQQKKVANYLVNPNIPEVLANPDFLIVPQPGTLISLDILVIPTSVSLWDFSLENIEVFIETKLATGLSTVVSLILLHQDEVPMFSDEIRLLKQMFDEVIEVSVVDPAFDKTIEHELHRLVENPQVKQITNAFLQSELRLRSVNYEVLSKRSNVQNVVRQAIEANQEANDEVLHVPDERIISQVILKTNAVVSINQKVLNLKHFFMHSIIQYYFTFDFMVRPFNISNFPKDQPIYADLLDRLFESGGSLNNIVTIQKNRVLSRLRLRRYATYARFISYKPSAERDGLEPLNHMPNLNLVINGILSGPEHAPERYINMLLAAGWNLVNAADIEGEIFLNRGAR